MPITVYDLPCGTREEYAAICAECGTDPIVEETAILSDVDELPDCARAVIDGHEPTTEYWEFLGEQTRAAQREHDREVSR